MTPALRHTLCDHAAGNYRILTTMAAELLAAAAQRELPQLDEKLYLEVFAQPEAPAPRRAGGAPLIIGHRPWPTTTTITTAPPSRCHDSATTPSSRSTTSSSTSSICSRRAMAIRSIATTRIGRAQHRRLRTDPRHRRPTVLNPPARRINANAASFTTGGVLVFMLLMAIPNLNAMPRPTQTPPPITLRDGPTDHHRT